MTKKPPSKQRINPMTKAEQPTIAQADIDAANLWANNIGRYGGVYLDTSQRQGLAIAFAKHHTTSLAAQDGLVEALGDALFNLSAKLNEAGFLKDDANHAAYEKVVSAFNGVSAIKGDKS